MGEMPQYLTDAWLECLTDSLSALHEGTKDRGDVYLAACQKFEGVILRALADARREGWKEAAEDVSRLRRAGMAMATWMLNWSQFDGRVLTLNDCQMLDDMRREWDAAIRAFAGCDEKDGREEGR